MVGMNADTPWWCWMGNDAVVDVIVGRTPCDVVYEEEEERVDVAGIVVETAATAAAVNTDTYHPFVSQ